MNIITPTLFDARLASENALPLKAYRLVTLQINLGKYCNQACRHCHVDAGPHRIAEQMSAETAGQIIDVLRRHSQIETVDITGGAPELNANFRRLVTESRVLGREVIDRCNLTVFFAEGQSDLPDFLAANQVRVIASLPCYLEENVDKQRGEGAFEKSIRALQLLNEKNYGRQNPDLKLDLIYNPLGATLPPPQNTLEVAYRRELSGRYGISFHSLFTLTNMPIARFTQDLIQQGKLDAYMALLGGAFNARTLPHLMCRSLISVGWDGRLYDCDFNQMLDLPVSDPKARHIRDFDFDALETRKICTGDHCFGCTAGFGSSCTGILA